ncbi:MAG: aldehyde ferredoxin oxidoreductase N-terminal domain-containing protein [Chloroflexota bacterium]
MPVWYSWSGAVLNVDLTTGRAERMPLDRDWAAKYLGGLAFGTRVLYDEVGPNIDPLSPGNTIVISPGLLSGTISPASSRCTLVSKSPLTNIFVRSNLGGFFGSEIKWAGYDMIVVHGQSPKPVYLWINNDSVELRDADHLWGEDTWTTERMLRDELGDRKVKTLKIGPAGENQCFSSAVIGDLSRAAGKCGIGAIWGSKRLKAIAVRGTKGIRVANSHELVQLTKHLWKRIERDPMYLSHSTHGTNSWVGDTIMLKSEGRFPLMPDLTSQALWRVYRKNISCAACALHCSHFYQINSGKYAGTTGDGVEGNTQIMCAAMGVNSSVFLCHYNNLCNQLGLDTWHPGTAINWAVRLYKEGILTKEDTDGIELRSGDEELILKLLSKIVRKEGFGALLDSYPMRAAAKVGRGEEQLVSHNKSYPGGGAGILLSMKMTLAHAVSTRGHDHLVGCPAGLESPGRQAEVTDETLHRVGKERYDDTDFFFEPAWKPSKKHAQRVYECENLFAIADMAGICKFAVQYALLDCGISMADIASLISTATGVAISVENLTQAAERELLLERAFNNREGTRRIDDHPHAFWYQLKYGKPHPKYPADLPTNLIDYSRSLDEYYKLRGCNLQTGVPTESKLNSVGLSDVAEDLRRRSLIDSASKETNQ